MKLGACELIEKIAEGSLAEIYLAKAPTKSGDEKCLVCKCVRPAVAGDSEFYDSIMVELECAGPLRHPNVVTIYNFCVDNGNAFRQDIHRLPDCVSGQILFVITEIFHFRHEQQSCGKCFQSAVKSPRLREQHAFKEKRTH